MPWRRPVFRLLVVKIYQAARDKPIDPRTRVRVQIDDEVIGWTCRGCNKNDDCDNPVEEKLYKVSWQS